VTDAPDTPPHGRRRSAGTRAALRLLRAVPAAALVLAVVASLALAVGPRIGAYRTITILSGSMEPRFEAGDVVVSTRLAAEDVRAGDVVTFHAPVDGAPLVTHRVTKVVEGGAHPVIRTKGDANPGADPWSARIEEDVVWRQRWVLPGVGHAIHALRQPATRAAVLYGSLALFLLVGLRAVWAPASVARERA
jgi:signal peptidase